MQVIAHNIRRVILRLRLSQLQGLVRRLACVTVFCFFSVVASSVFAAEVYGVIELSNGNVRIVDAQGQSRLAQQDDKVMEGDTIITGQGGEIQIRTDDHGFVAVRSNTKLRIDAYSAHSDASDKSVMSLLAGTIRSITGWIGKTHPESYAIKTPSATIGVRGTDHEPQVILPPEPGQQAIAEPGTYDKVNQGSTVLRGEKGTVQVQANQAAFAAHDKALAPRALDAIPTFYKPSRFENRIDRRKGVLAQNMEKHQQARAGKNNTARGERRAGETVKPHQRKLQQRVPNQR